MENKDVFLLEGIVRSCDDILETMARHGASEEALRDDYEYQYVCSFALIQIGEYANGLSARFTHAHPEIPWRGIVGMRNQLTHRYGDSCVPFIWQTISTDIEPLKQFCMDQISTERD